MNVPRPYDATTMKTNGTPKRTGYFLTVWFNEPCFTGLRRENGNSWDFYESVVVVEDWPKVPNLSLHSLECRLWHMHVSQKHRCEFAKNNTQLVKM